MLESKKWNLQTRLISIISLSLAEWNSNSFHLTWFNMTFNDPVFFCFLNYFITPGWSSISRTTEARQYQTYNDALSLLLHTSGSVTENKAYIWGPLFYAEENALSSYMSVLLTSSLTRRHVCISPMSFHKRSSLNVNLSYMFLSYPVLSCVTAYGYTRIWWHVMTGLH